MVRGLASDLRLGPHSLGSNEIEKNNDVLSDFLILGKKIIVTSFQNTLIIL